MNSSGRKSQHRQEDYIQENKQTTLTTTRNIRQEYYIAGIPAAQSDKANTDDHGDILVIPMCGNFLVQHSDIQLSISVQLIAERI